MEIGGVRAIGRGVMRSVGIHVEQASPVKQILFCGAMVPTLLPVRPGLHSMDAGLL